MKDTDEQSQTQQKNHKEHETQYVISPRQSAIFISSTIIGSGILTLPRVATKHAHETAWLSVILATFVSIVLIYVLTVLALRFPRQTFIEYMGDIVGIKNVPFIGNTIRYFAVIYFIVFWFSIVALITRTFGEVITTSILLNTPIQWIIAPMLLLGGVIVYYEVEVLARFNEIVFPLIILPSIIFVALSLRKAEFINLLPFFAIGWESFLKSIVEISFSFLGYGIMLIFMAYTQKKSNITSNIVGIAIPGFLYCIIVIACIAVFGYKELERIHWSTLELVKSAVIPGAVLERTEAIFISVWVMAIFTSLANLLYAGCFSIAQLFNIKKKNQLRFRVALISLPVLYFAAIYPEDLSAVHKWETYLNYIGIITLLIFPLLLLIVAAIRGKGEKYGKGK